MTHNPSFAEVFEFLDDCMENRATGAETMQVPLADRLISKYGCSAREALHAVTAWTNDRFGPKDK